MGRSGRPAFGAGGAPPAPTKTTLPSSSNAQAPTSTSNRSTKSAKRESRARAVCSARVASVAPSIVISKSLSEGSRRNSSLAHAQLATRVSCAGVSLATSESSGGGRPARFSGATRFGRAFGAFTGATHVALCVRQHAIQQYAARHLGQLYFAAGVAQTAQGRSGRGIGVAFAMPPRARRRSCCCGGGTGACYATGWRSGARALFCRSAEVTEERLKINPYEHSGSWAPAAARCFDVSSVSTCR